RHKCADRSGGRASIGGEDSGGASKGPPPLPNGKTRFVDLYAGLGVIGYGPDQVDRWEPYQIMAIYQGYITANSPKTAKPPTDEEFRAAVARVTQ
ncbi:MAG TPA: hypothetical protein VLZ84_11720, partial [Asticcacaulis sp.]|nr:hypothetical protein [Asticcacaulis sp.]